MSLLIEKNMRTSGPKLVPGDVKNVDIKSGVGKISIKWTDPDDTTYENYTFIKWKGTILIRKKDSAPSNVNDGVVLINSTIKNQYKDTAYEDNNLEDGNYYYRFFVYSEDNIYNNGSNMIYNTNVVSADPILKNNSWETIVDIANKGQGQNYWKIGDEIDVTLTNKKVLTFQIYDFDHFDKSDGSGKANICFGMKNLMYFERPMNNSGTSEGGWNRCYMRNTVILSEIINIIPLELKNIIKEVNTYAHNPSNYKGPNLLCKDKLFLPGYKELGALGEYVNFENSQKQFPIFTNDKSRIKKCDNGSGNAYTYWTRSPIYDSTTFHPVDENGCADLDRTAYNEYGVCFCFNI